MSCPRTALVAVMIVLAASFNDPSVLAQGVASCEALNKARSQGTDNASYVQAVAWILGFVTAYTEYGVYRPISLKGTDSSALTEWIGNYCQTYPLKTIHEAARALATELEIRSLK
jgi:hypothetical protein